MLLRLLFSAALAVVVHLLIGWEWTVAAAVAAGFTQGRGGWMLGALAVLIDYAGLLAYSYAVDVRAFGMLTGTMGSLLGNMPSPAIVAITLLIGGALGAVGGAAGTQLHKLTELRRSKAPA